MSLSASCAPRIVLSEYSRGARLVARKRCPKSVLARRLCEPDGPLDTTREICQRITEQDRLIGCPADFEQSWPMLASTGQDSSNVGRSSAKIGNKC